MAQEEEVLISTHAYNGDMLTFKSSNIWTEQGKKLAPQRDCPV